MWSDALDSSRVALSYHIMPLALHMTNILICSQIYKFIRRNTERPQSPEAQQRWRESRQGKMQGERECFVLCADHAYWT